MAYQIWKMHQDLKNCHSLIRGIVSVLKKLKVIELPAGSYRPREWITSRMLKAMITDIFADIAPQEIPKLQK